MRIFPLAVSTTALLLLPTASAAPKHTKQHDPDKLQDKPTKSNNNNHSLPKLRGGGSFATSTTRSHSHPRALTTIDPALSPYLRNIALGKPTTQKSTCHGGEASRATDGNTDGVWGHQSVTHTCNWDQWWRVDFNDDDDDMAVLQVKVYNRNDCCGGRLSDAVVEILSSNGDVVAHATLGDMSGVSERTIDFGLDVTGSSVKISKQGVISLAEVEVMGVDLCPSVAGTSRKVSPGKITIPSIGELGKLCTLTKVTYENDGEEEEVKTIIPLARSYDDQDWGNAAGEIPAVDLAGGWDCHSSSGTTTGTYCSADLPELEDSNEAYVLTTLKHTLSSPRDEVARFLNMATFGVTTTELDGWDYDDSVTPLGQTFANWVQDQMNTDMTPASIHREFWRRRANAPVPGSFEFGPVADPCKSKSLWRTVAIGKNEWRTDGRGCYQCSEKTVELLSDTGNTTRYVIKSAGQIRSVVNEVNKDAANPAVDFTGFEHLLSNGVIALPDVGVAGEVDKMQPHEGSSGWGYLLETPLQCNLPRLEAFDVDGAIVGRLPSGQYLLYDGMLDIRDNVPSDPIADGGGLASKESADGSTLCANAPRTFLNSDGCRLSYENDVCRDDYLVDAGVANGDNPADGASILVCGSPGEVSNDVTFRNRDSFELDPDKLRRTSRNWTGNTSRTTWAHLSIKAYDQLRQRMAFVLNQIFAVARETTYPFGISEIVVNFHDIFIRNAFGNYRDILKEISYSPVMARNLSYLKSKSLAYVRKTLDQFSNADENFAREIMQLFTIGTVLLNHDGTLKRDPDSGEEVLSFSTVNVMNGARAWTGFDIQKPRGNYEDSREGNLNLIDPMNIKAEWRDKFPKLNLHNGYIGDHAYPLCEDLPSRMFLTKGAHYRFIGGSKLPEMMHTKPEYLNSEMVEFELDVSSQLRSSLCDGAGLDCKSQPLQNEIVLASTLACSGTIECSVDTESTPAHALCANPRLSTAFEACCEFPPPGPLDGCEECFNGNPCMLGMCTEEGGCLNSPRPGCSNGALVEYWFSLDYSSGTSVSALTNDARYPHSPSSSIVLNENLELPANYGGSYGARLKTYITPPTTGNYTFFVSGDDKGELWLSSSSDPGGVSRIAYFDAWTQTNDFDRWDSQKSDTISLVQGESYYLEAFLVEGGGSDSLSVAWESSDAGITQSIIPVNYTHLDLIPGPIARMNNIYDDERVTFSTALARCEAHAAGLGHDADMCDYSFIDDIASPAHKAGYHWTNVPCQTKIKITADETLPGWISIVHNTTAVAAQHVDERSENYFPAIWNSFIDTSNSSNIALGKTTAQSSTCYGGEASRATDGNTGGNWHYGSVTHTCFQSNPWWSVDLGSGAEDKAFLIFEVKVYNRNDCCSGRLSDAWIEILSSNGDVVANATLGDMSGVSERTIDFGPDGTAGSTVRISSSSSNVISLAEVEVIGAESGSSRYPQKADMCHGAGSGCEVIEEGCFCDVIVSESAGYNAMPLSVNDALGNLFIGAVDPAISMLSYVTEEDETTGIVAYKIGTEFDQNTIFEVHEERTDRTFFLKNVVSTVNVGRLYSFRNAPHFMSLVPSEADVKDAQYETEAVLDDYFYHENTAPFLARLFIQRFNVASNPTPAYVAAVATAFQTGIYVFNDATTFGLGEYGDLSATVAAILLHPEAASPTVDADPASGSVRQPLLKVIAVMRSLDLEPYNGQPRMPHRIGNVPGQGPYDYTTVFSHFQADTPTSSRGSPAGFYAPEESSLDLPQISGSLNKYYGTFFSMGFNSRYGFGTNWSGEIKWHPVNSALSAEVVGELATLLTSSRLSEENREIITGAYSVKLASSGTSKAKQLAMQLIASTAEFHTTNLMIKSGKNRGAQDEGDETFNGANDYKSVVYLNLSGGVDSYNMLVPHTCEDTVVSWPWNNDKTLDEQYRIIRGGLALDREDLRQIDPGNDEQPCTVFGLHPRLQSLASMYDEGDALFMANVVSVVPCSHNVCFFLLIEVNQYVCHNHYSYHDFATISIAYTQGYLSDPDWKKTTGRIGSHAYMQKYVAKVDPFAKYGDTGVMGRMRDTLVKVGHKTSAIHVTGSGLVLSGVGGLTAGPVAVGVNGVQEFPLYVDDTSFTSQIMSLNNATAPTSGFMAEAWSSKMSSSLSIMDELREELNGATAQTSFPKLNSLGDQLKMVSRLQQTAANRGVSRDLYSVEYGSWDHHGGLAGPLDSMFQQVDDALAAYAAELKQLGLWESTVLIETSEFGRTMYPNGNMGTDHGWAGHYFAIGGGLDGGKIVGRYPANMWENMAGHGRRPVPTTPWESVWNSVAEWLGVSEVADLNKVGPNRVKFDSQVLFGAETLFTSSPTTSPTNAPTDSPTTSPTNSPTKTVTGSPTTSPTNSPTKTVTGSSTTPPTNSPTKTVTGSSTTPPTPAPTPGVLVVVGNNWSPADKFPLGECQGDCDVDEDCDGPNLFCFQRGAIEPVPGCSGDGVSGEDYCYALQPTTSPTPSPTFPSGVLVVVGNNWSPADKFPLGECQGDCDVDSDCDGPNLFCFQRGGIEPVPGCSGDGVSGTDYCYLA
ncbi:hypothetical protein ACHAXR_013016 [Thalassiosira sp. AJA248-18]